MGVSFTSSLGLREIGDETLSGEKQTGDRSGVLKSAASHLGRVDHPTSYEIFVGVASDVITNVTGLVLHVLNNEGTFAACVCGELAKRSFDSAHDDVSTSSFITFEAEVPDTTLGADESSTTTCLLYTSPSPRD